MTEQELQEIKNRCQAATPGPFTAIGGTIFCDGADECGRGCFILYDRQGYLGPDCNREADSKFFAHARVDVPTLLAEVDRLRQTNKRLIHLLQKIGYDPTQVLREIQP